MDKFLEIENLKKDVIEAVIKGNTESLKNLIKELLAKKKNPSDILFNIPGTLDWPHGGTAVHAAVIGGHIEVLKIVIACNGK
jgi:hypothetical protein